MQYRDIIKWIDDDGFSTNIADYGIVIFSNVKEMQLFYLMIMMMVILSKGWNSHGLHTAQP